MSGFLLDTCVISEFRRPRPDVGVVAWLAGVDVQLVHLSSVTLGELRYGIAILKERARRLELERWLTVEVLGAFQGRILAFDADVADRWGEIRSRGRLAGKTIPPIDAMLAATALHHRLSVVTRNEGDFARADVPLINPWSE